MEKKLSEHDLTMIIYARKYLDDALHELDYGEFEEESKARIKEAIPHRPSPPHLHGERC